jgi:hypothetical protein
MFQACENDKALKSQAADVVNACWVKISVKKNINTCKTRLAQLFEGVFANGNVQGCRNCPVRLCLCER